MKDIAIFFLPFLRIKYFSAMIVFVTIFRQIAIAIKLAIKINENDEKKKK